MGVNPGIAGRAYPPARVYEVGREKIAEFAAAVGSTDPAHLDPESARSLGHPDVVAPPTFAIILAQRAEAAIVQDRTPASTTRASSTASSGSRTTARSWPATGWSPPPTSTPSARPAATGW